MEPLESRYTPTDITLTNPGPFTDNEGDPVTQAVAATNIDDSALNYSATGLPGGLSIDPNSGVISGTVATILGSYAPTITVADDQGSVSEAIPWSIGDNLSLTNPGSLYNNEGDAVSQSINAQGGGGGVTLSASGLPGGLTMDANGNVTGTVATPTQLQPDRERHRRLDHGQRDGPLVHRRYAVHEFHG